MAISTLLWFLWMAGMWRSPILGILALCTEILQNTLALSQGCMEDASDIRIQVNLILVELCENYVPVHYLGVVSPGITIELLLIFKLTEYNYLSIYCDKILHN
jgi:hypothetical protein